MQIIAHARRWSIRLLLAASAAASLCVIPGCWAPPSQIRIASERPPAVMTPKISTAVYTSADDNTADVYLSDLPLVTLRDPAADLSTATGNLIHIHLFLFPAPGRIPLREGAFDATIHHLILAGGQAGCYQGGGFIMPSHPPGDGDFSAQIQDFTMRLGCATPAFADRLGAPRLTGQFSAERDDAAARAIAERISHLMTALPRTPNPTSTPAPAPTVTPNSRHGK